MSIKYNCKTKVENNMAIKNLTKMEKNLNIESFSFGKLVTIREELSNIDFQIGVMKGFSTYDWKLKNSLMNDIRQAKKNIRQRLCMHRKNNK